MQALFFQRNGEAFYPSRQLYPPLRRLQIDHDPMLVAHGQDSGACSNGCAAFCRGIGTLKIRHLPQMVDLPGRPHCGHANSADLQPLYGKLVAFSLGRQRAIALIGANANGNGRG